MEEVDIQRLHKVLTSIVGECEMSSHARDEIAIEHSGDAVDQVSAAARREVAAHQLELNARRLGEAIAALRRIEEGTYGTCLGCDAPIALRRLTAVPWTRYCVGCQESADKNENGTELSQRLMGNLLNKSQDLRLSK